MERLYLQWEQRLDVLMEWVDEYNPAEVLVNGADWNKLLAKFPRARGKDANGPLLLIDGRTFRKKPPTKEPSGRWDFTGTEPQRLD
jgi:hypothetical protein